MDKPERLQANFRIDAEDQRRMQDVRRMFITDDGKVASETLIWKIALKEFHDRLRVVQKPRR